MHNASTDSHVMYCHSPTCTYTGKRSRIGLVWCEKLVGQPKLNVCVCVCVLLVFHSGFYCCATPTADLIYSMMKDVTLRKKMKKRKKENEWSIYTTTTRRCSDSHFLTCIQWVFNAHQCRPVPIVHFLDNVIFWNVGAPILDANACAHVVEGATVQLKELNQ